MIYRRRRRQALGSEGPVGEASLKQWFVEKINELAQRIPFRPLRGRGALVVAVAIAIGGAAVHYHEEMLSWEWVGDLKAFVMHPFGARLPPPRARPASAGPGTRILPEGLHFVAALGQEADSPEQIILLLARLNADPGDKTMLALRDELNELRWTKDAPGNRTPVMLVVPTWRRISLDMSNPVAEEQRAQGEAREVVGKLGGAAIIYGVAGRQPLLRIEFARALESCAREQTVDSRMYHSLPPVDNEKFRGSVDALANVVISGHLFRMPRGRLRILPAAESELLQRIESVTRRDAVIESSAPASTEQAERSAGLAMLVADVLVARSGGYRDANLADAAVRQATQAVAQLDQKKSASQWAALNLHAAIMSVEEAAVVYGQDRPAAMNRQAFVDALMADAEQRFRSVVAATETNSLSIHGALARYYLGMTLYLTSKPLNQAYTPRLEEAEAQLRSAVVRFGEMNSPEMEHEAEANRAAATASIPAKDPKAQQQARDAILALDALIPKVNKGLEQKLWAYVQFQKARAQMIVGDGEKKVDFFRAAAESMDKAFSVQLAGCDDPLSERLGRDLLVDALVLQTVWGTDVAPMRRAAKEARDYAARLRATGTKVWGEYESKAGDIELSVATRGDTDPVAASRAIEAYESAKLSGTYDSAPEQMARLNKAIESAKAIQSARGKN
jgi:hypothetical protein